MTKYPKMEDGTQFSLDMRNELWRFACCDCGLVHSMAFSVDERDRGRLIMTIVREPRATAQLRRHAFGYLQQEDPDERYVMARRDNGRGS